MTPTSAKFKAKVAMEAIRGDLTLAEWVARQWRTPHHDRRWEAANNGWHSGQNWRRADATALVDGEEVEQGW